MPPRPTVPLAAAMALGVALLLVGASAYAAGTRGGAVAAAAAPPVEVTLYAEALCPYCAAFVTDTLGPLVGEPWFDAVVKFRYVAWGNAVNTSRGVMCQHGPAECRLNRVLNCAEALLPTQAAFLRFALCLEGAPAKRMEEAVDECATKEGMPAAARLHTCAGGVSGDMLERAAAAETAALQPPHEYVPWVTVQGIALGAPESTADLLRYVCVAFAGERPEACYAPPPGAALALPGGAAGRVTA